MDISNLVTYENPLIVELKNPVTGDGMGIFFHVISADSKPVVKAIRDLQAAWMRDRAVNGDGAAVPDFETAALVACVSDWIWGENTFGHISDGTPATEENKRFVFEHPHAVWIRAQISNASSRLENFTQK